MGVPHRIGALDRALQYIRSHDRVWFATGEEIIRHAISPVEKRFKGPRERASLSVDRGETAECDRALA